MEERTKFDVMIKGVPSNTRIAAVKAFRDLKITRVIKGASSVRDLKEIMVIKGVSKEEAKA